MASGNVGVARAHRISDGPKPQSPAVAGSSSSSSAAVPLVTPSADHHYVRPQLRQRSYTNPSYSSSAIAPGATPSAIAVGPPSISAAASTAATYRRPPSGVPSLTLSASSTSLNSIARSSAAAPIRPGLHSVHSSSAISSLAASSAGGGSVAGFRSTGNRAFQPPPLLAPLQKPLPTPGLPTPPDLLDEAAIAAVNPQLLHASPSRPQLLGGPRDSFLSIVNDPFFVQYHDAESPNSPTAKLEGLPSLPPLPSQPDSPRQRQHQQAQKQRNSQQLLKQQQQQQAQQAQQQLSPVLQPPIHPPPTQPLPPTPKQQQQQQQQQQLPSPPPKQQLPPLPLQPPHPPPQTELPPLPPNPRQQQQQQQQFQQQQQQQFQQQQFSPTTSSQRDDRKPPLTGLNPRRESLPGRDLYIWSNPPPVMESVYVAAIGGKGIGKSSLIQRALALQRLPTYSVSRSQKPMVVDGTPVYLTIIEIDLGDWGIEADQPVQWPRQIEGHSIPRVDGALLMYDVMNKESLAEFPAALSALGKSALPTVLVATKCDNPENARQISTSGMTAACTSCIASFKTAYDVPESTRVCFAALIRAVLSLRKNAENADPGGMLRKRAASAINLDTPPDSATSRPLSQQSKHSRASSDLSLLRGFPAPPPGSVDYFRNQTSSRSPRVDPNSPSFPNSSAYSEDPGAQTVAGMLRTPGIRLDRGIYDSFYIEESDAESHRYSDDIPILQRNDDAYQEKPAKQAGVSFGELVDRLLGPKMSRADSNFTDVFLCLYRKFAAPGELFGAILDLMDRESDKNTHYLAKTGTQLRMIEVVAKWVATYPGDFARPATRQRLEEFINRLSNEPIFSAAAQEMRRHLRSVVEDDDTIWAKTDDLEDVGAAGKESSFQLELSQGMSSLQLDDFGTSGTGGAGNSMGALGSAFGSERRPSTNSEFSTVERDSSSATAASGPSSGPGSSGHFQFHSYDDYAREAATLDPTQMMPLTKNRYHIFMDTSDDDIADEMTRIDWIMFSSIRMRDLVRHVSLSLEGKAKCRSLVHVNRMVDHFNHVAKWVANMILMRDKSKHRAQMLDKFMNIALKLRLLNNYNGLAAVLAGINGSAIHRLAQTRALVPAETGKKFARLVILMGTQKSHFAYRLAWENSPLPRIPFMPLHRRDLVSAEEGSRTFVGPQGDRINWKKFEVLGEVLLPIMRSQGTPYPNLAQHDTARELILQCRMPTDDEEIYQRSLQVESSSGNAADAGKKKFPWFAK